jgi:hypothetical protein
MIEILYFEDFANCINYVGMEDNWICLSPVVGDEPNHQINLNFYFPLLELNDSECWFLALKVSNSKIYFAYITCLF